MAAEDDIEQLSWQVLDIIIGKLGDLIGEGAITVLRTIQEADRSAPPNPQLVYRLGNELEEVVGKKGAFSLLRQVGREVGEMFTGGKSPEEATEILAVTLRNLGFAYEIRVQDEEAYICKCVFYDLLAADGHKPIQKPVCWTGWGFIEGCMKNVNGAHHVQWKGRNIEARECRFEIRQSANQWDGKAAAEAHSADE